MSSLKLSKSGRVVLDQSDAAKNSSEGIAPSAQSFWRNMSELEATPEFGEFIAREYPEQEKMMADKVSRRRFVQLMGASFAFAGVAQGCRWEEEKILPLSRRPEGYVPGVAKHYASAFELGGAAAGLLVTCMDGRPIKIEGNPQHPFTGRASTGLAQASILEMYDPDRSQGVARQEGGKATGATTSDLLATLRQLRDAAKSAGGRGLHVLSEASSSPTIAALRKEMQAAMPGMRWHEYEALSHDNQREGNRLAFGAPHRTHYRLDKAQVVASFDAELFGNHPAALRHARDFASMREPDAGRLNRVYVVESSFSSTGTTADHRLPLRSELIKPVLLGLEQAISQGDLASVGSAILEEEKVKKFVLALARDLTQNRGRSVVAVGSQQPADVHAIAARINQTLGNLNATVFLTADSDENRPAHLEDLKALVSAMQGGQVQGLVILGGNPVYNAPVDLDFAGALAKVGVSVHLSNYHDETSKLVNWHVNRAHYLECWGDATSWDGTLTVQQPMIEPLYKGMSSIDLLKIFVGKEDTAARDLVRDTFVASTGAADAEAAWRRFLHNGFHAGTAARAEAVQVKPFNFVPLTAEQKQGTRIPNGKLEVTFRESYTYDGRYANNGWLVETPDFVTKLTWDNAALISPATAKDLGIKNGDMVKVSLGDRTLKIVALVQPGQAAYSIALPLGWGRKRAGYVGGHEDHDIAPIGFDTYALRTAGGFWSLTGATVKKAGGTYPLAETQDHYDLDKLGQEAIAKRSEIHIKTATVGDYNAKGEKVITDHAHQEVEKVLLRPNASREMNASLYDEYAVAGQHQWGMSIDLGKCTGCNACLLACQSENNVPIVGKEEVINNREMHWIRIDRYFQGSPDNPTMAMQPVHCQQCESAPCEVVCPVEATMHSQEGLNDMAYNRCVGTRYCANNCPYKVRRFNYKYWNKDFELARNKVRKLLSNPDVTVRGRGVMEKCTWCVQRIERTKIDAKNNRRPLRDGEIVTACEQACATGAITFGDLADKNSQVSKKHSSNRAYNLLAYLNNKPRNAFLARITNPNPALSTTKDTQDHE